MSKIESLGTLRISGGTEEEIDALFTVYKADRAVTVCQTSTGTIVVSTKSWLRQNEHDLVQTVKAYTLETFAMMLETMLLGSEYLGIDIQKEVKKLHAGDGAIKYECAGRGEPSFMQTNDTTSQPAL